MTREFTIEPAELSISFEPETLTYNGAVQTVTATVSGAVGGDDVADLYTGPVFVPVEFKDAGKYTAHFELTEDASGYKWEGQEYSQRDYDGTVTINKNKVTPTWDGAEFVYDRGKHEPALSIETE